MKKLCAVISICFLVVVTAKANSVLSDRVKSLLEKAEAGDAQSQFMLANAYDSGRGATRNGSEAVKWYTKAAHQGHAEAQNSLGSIYQAEKRYSEALPWFKMAADQNHSLAINNLAYLYDLGLGVSQSRERAHELYMQSANLG